MALNLENILLEVYGIFSVEFPTINQSEIEYTLDPNSSNAVVEIHVSQLAEIRIEIELDDSNTLFMAITAKARPLLDEMSNKSFSLNPCLSNIPENIGQLLEHISSCFESNKELSCKLKGFIPEFNYENIWCKTSISNLKNNVSDFINRHKALLNSVLNFFRHFDETILQNIENIDKSRIKLQDIMNTLRTSQ
jgi:hypothetical protein